MSCKYLQGFIDSISGWLLFVTIVWMAVGKSIPMLEGQAFFHSTLRSCFTHVLLYTTCPCSHYEANGHLLDLCGTFIKQAVQVDDILAHSHSH